jgi:hypothetical protein
LTCKPLPFRRNSRCHTARRARQPAPAAGQKLQVVEYEGRIELIPERDITELRGFLKGIDTSFEREDDRL